MSTRYVAKTGDNLSKIAATFHLRSWADIYNDPENADFRRRHPNPNLIYTGDVLMVPDPPGVFNHQLPDPPYVTQANIFWCWAAAMESWLTVTPGRDMFNQNELRAMFAGLTDPSNGGLTPAGWGAVATRFNMEARMFTLTPLPGSTVPRKSPQNLSTIL
jgi:outer membrane phospholipase A